MPKLGVPFTLSPPIIAIDNRVLVDSGLRPTRRFSYEEIEERNRFISYELKNSPGYHDVPKKGHSSMIFLQIL